MTDQVQLSPSDIRGQLQQVMRRREDPRPVALYGTGPSGVLEVDGVEWTIVPVGSELELRAALLETAHDTAVAYLVDYDDRLPLDVACRLAGQKVHPVDRRTRLANLFGARKVAPGLATTALADILLDENPELPPISGTLLQPDDAWRRYLAARLQLHLDGMPDAASLLSAGLEQTEAGPRFAARRTDDEWTRLLADAADWVELRSGSSARVVWEAWLAGRLQDLVPWLIHIDAARRSEDSASTILLRQALRYAREAEESWLEEAIAGPLCAALDRLLRALPADRLRDVLTRARQVFDDPDFASARRASEWLPDGFDALLSDLAAALEQSVQDPTRLPEALALFHTLEGHHLTQADPGSAAVREAAVRLCAWLGWLPHRPLPEEPGWTGMAALAKWYDAEGGWVDWAREVLRTRDAAHSAFDAASAVVLERADAVRRDLDRRFAEATLSWYAAGKPSTDVLPIERVTRDVAAEFLKGPNRRLLVVLLDGMSASVATRLLDAQDGWAPVAWTPGKHRVMPPAIASLPSLTSTSRAAFFAGKQDVRFGDESESKDRLRFSQNAALQGLAAGTAGPSLFLKPDLGGTNTLSEPLLAALRDERERIVAVVVNAIDDQLKGSDQIAIPYEKPGSIPVLERLLRAARETERAVLLVSDHGHIPAHVMTGNAPPSGTTENGHRWRALRDNQIAQDGEVELPTGCWKPRGAKAVAVFHDERRAWGNARFGAHGGLTLAEVVIPVRLLAPNWLFSVLQPPDDQLRTRDPHPPRWWGPTAPPSTDRHQQQPVEPPKQPDLFPSMVSSSRKAMTPGPTPSLDAPRHPLTESLAASELFHARAKEQPADRRDLALSFVDALLQAHGHALSREAFARAVGIKARRVPGRVAMIGFLNADGFTVIEDDLAGNQVRLHVDRLKAQYDLEN